MSDKSSDREFTKSPSKKETLKVNNTKNHKNLRIYLQIVIIFFVIIVPDLFVSTVSGQSQTFTSSGSFTVPAGVSSITVKAWGAGGGGSRILSTSKRGGGGGGGAFASSVISVITGSIYTVTVGKGGSYNSDGGNSSFGSNLVKAEGGKGGSNNSSNAGAGGKTSNCIGSVTYSGGDGASGGTIYSGGGGGAAGSTGNGTHASGMNPGQGTSENGGDGGTGVSKSSNGNDGKIYGGGGSGACTNSGTDRDGGSGADGLVVIEWTAALPVSNNNIDFINGLHGTICITVQEHETASFSSPSGTLFSYISFASYGTPGGACPDFTIGSCNATNSRTIVEGFLLGSNSADIPAENSIFGDPCYGTYKSMSISAIYTEPVCSGSVPGTITGSVPEGGNSKYTYLWESSTTSASSGFSTASGTNNTKDYNPPALIQTTWFRRTVTSAGFSSTSPALQVTVNAISVIKWTGLEDTDWNNSANWCGGIPSALSNVEIAVRLNQPVLNNSAECNDLTIDAGALLTIGTTGKLTVNGTIVNKTGLSGLILRSDATGTASLMHNTNNVQATMYRYINGSAEAWHFISSPVSDQEISGSWLPSGTYGNGTGYDLYVWDEASGCWIYKLNTTNTVNWNTVHPQTYFVPGRGYLYSVQALNPTKQFAGILNNGTINIQVTSAGSDLTMKGINLAGNPYPSSIDWQSASGWDRSALQSSGSGYDMWIWNPSANNYGVINSAGGTGTNGVSRYIAPAQGFMVRAQNTGSLVVNNSARSVNGSSGWMKKGEDQTFNIFRVTVESKAGNGFDEVQMLFGSEKESDGAVKMFSRVESAPSLYTQGSEEPLTIKYLTDTISTPGVPVMFRAGSDGAFALKVSFDQDQFATAILEDREMNFMQDMKLNDTYNFISSVKDNDSRFVVHFVKPALMSNLNSEFIANAYESQGRMVFDLTRVSGIVSVNVFDLYGRSLCRKDLTGGSEHEINLDARSQMLVITMNNGAGRVTKKIMWINN